jgi:hypothetical protein
LKRGDREGRHAFCIKPGLILSPAKIAYRLQEKKNQKTAEKNEKLTPKTTQQIEHYKQAEHPPSPNK